MEPPNDSANLINVSPSFQELIIYCYEEVNENLDVINEILKWPNADWVGFLVSTITSPLHNK